MPKKSVTKNYIYNLTYQVLILILPLITTPYVSRVLGAENIGIYSYTISIVTYFILFGSLGISIYGQREIAYIRDSKKETSKVFWEIVIFRFITMSISSILFYFGFVQSNEYSMYYKILLLELLANCLDISWFFQGQEEFKKAVMRNTIIKLVSILLIFVFIKGKEDLVLYFVIYVLSNLSGNLSLWIYLPKYLEKIKIKEIKIFRHFKPTLSLFIPQIAIQVYTLLDKVMLGSMILNKAEVGYYDQSQKIIRMLLTIVTSLGTVMLPRMANTFMKGDNKKIKEYMKKSFRFAFGISIPMIIGIIMVADAFVPIFFGEGYAKVAILMKTISPILLFIGLSNVIGTQYLLPTKRQKAYTTSVVCGAMLNFTINMLLIKQLGALGASIGTIIAEITVAGIQIFCIRKEFNLKEIVICSKHYVISGIMMFGLLYIIGKLPIDNEPVIMIAQIIIGIVIYGTVLILQKDEIVMELLEKVKYHFTKSKTMDR